MTSNDLLIDKKQAKNLCLLFFALASDFDWLSSTLQKRGGKGKFMAETREGLPTLTIRDK